MRGIALACVLVVASVSSTHAQPAPTELTKEFQAGVDAFRLGKFDEARTHLEKARELDPKLPGPYRFLAAVAQAQGKWDDCIANARKALELNPQSSETVDTRKVHDECRVSAGRLPYRGDLSDSAAIAVNTNVPGATVKINGLTYGATPLAPRPITAGELEIQIDKLGWKSATRTIKGLPGIVTDVIVDLEPDPNVTANELQSQNEAKLDKGWLIIRRPTGAGARDAAWPPRAGLVEESAPSARQSTASDATPAGTSTAGMAGRVATNAAGAATTAGTAVAATVACNSIVDDGDQPISRREARLLVDGAAATGCTWDQKDAGALRFELSPGTHTIEVKVPLSDPWRRRVRIAAGQKTVVQPVLVDHDARSAVEKRGVYVVGGGAFLLVTGFVAAMISRDAANEARDIVRIETARDPAQPLSVSGAIAPVRTRGDLEDATSKAKMFGRISDAAYGAGLVALGVGAYYLYKGARERTDGPPPFAIAPTRGGVFVAKEIAW